MNIDYRISLTWRRSVKRAKLHRRLGSTGVLSLVDLWAAVAEHRPDGIMTGWDQEDIELQSGWDGKPGNLISVLVDLRLLDFNEKSKTYSIHDWAIWNPYAAQGEERSRIGRVAAEARWKKEREKKLQESGHADPGMPNACGGHASGTQDAMQGDSNSNAPYLTHSNHTSPNPTTPPPPTPDQPDENGSASNPPEGKPTSGHDQNQVVGGDQDNGQGQDPNQKPRIEGNYIEDLLRLLWKYQTAEGVKNPDTFFQWKRDKLMKEGLSEKDRQDMERLRKREAQEVAEKEDKEAERRRLEEAERRQQEEDIQLYADFEALPEIEKKRIENLTQKRGISPGGPAWRAGVATIMRNYISPATAGEVAGKILASRRVSC